MKPDRNNMNVIRKEKQTNCENLDEMKEKLHKIDLKRKQTTCGNLDGESKLKLDKAVMKRIETIYENKKKKNGDKAFDEVKNCCMIYPSSEVKSL